MFCRTYFFTQGDLLMKMNRFALASLTLALTSFAISNPSFAQSASRMTTGNAQLVGVLDTASATSGQAVTARLTATVKISDNIKLPRGTQLIGHVDQVKPAEGGNGAQITLTFNSAQLKDGKILPIKATLVELAPEGTALVLTDVIAPDSAYTEQDRIPGVALHSEVQSDSSAVLTSKVKNIHLAVGTELLFGIAPGTAATTAAASN
jgi:hypothetical protein